ncbi:MAG: hypothetical protein K2K92_06415, partial [Duncaniella sp.]|nr:hypothetical protein [Duncaniella sp.]
MHGKILNERLIAYAGIWGAVAVSASLIGIMIVMYIAEIRRAIRTTSSLTHAYSRFKERRNARREERRLQIETNDEVRNLRAEIDTLQHELEEARAKAARTATAVAFARPAAATAQGSEDVPDDAEDADHTAAETGSSAAEGNSHATHPGDTHPEMKEEAKDADGDNTHAAEDAEKTDGVKVDEDTRTALEDKPKQAEAAARRVRIDPSEMPLFPTPEPVSDADDDGFDAPLFPTSAPSEQSAVPTPTAASAEPVAQPRPRVQAHTELPGEPAETERPMMTPMQIEESQAQADIHTPTPEHHAEAPVSERPADPRDQEPYDPRAELANYRFPTLDLLRDVATRSSVDVAEMEENNARITKTLNDYGIGISHIKATVGPTVTLYEIVPAVGVRISKIKSLEDDIALNLAALGIRIIAPIPGRGTIGIEVPNKDPQTVSMRSVLESEKYQTSHMDLPMAIGRTVSNEVFMADLTKMPHLLVAGATGMGKSVGLNAIIASLLYKKHPSELKFVMIDPKQVEFSLYAKLERHYLAKLPDEDDAIITDPLKVVATLNSLCVEMDNRYALLKDAQMRNIKEYNERFVQHRLSPAQGHRFMPYIVVIVDEFADLIMTAGKDVETPIARIAQKARAVGRRVIRATETQQRNVYKGLIKAILPRGLCGRVYERGA